MNIKDNIIGDIEEDDDTSNALEFRAIGVRDAIDELNFLLLDIDD